MVRSIGQKKVGKKHIRNIESKKCSMQNPLWRNLYSNHLFGGKNMCQTHYDFVTTGVVE